VPVDQAQYAVTTNDDDFAQSPQATGDTDAGMDSPTAEGRGPVSVPTRPVPAKARAEAPLQAPSRLSVFDDPRVVRADHNYAVSQLNRLRASVSDRANTGQGDQANDVE